MRLPELLITVDNDLDWTRHFRPRGRRATRTADEVCQVGATIMVYGCNLGPETMAHLTTRVSYEDIPRITDWSLHDEPLRAALADIVNAMLALDTTQVWGDGSTSSSDGQRFLFPHRVLRRTSSHRLGDFALEFYPFIAANYAPFYSVPLECTERDAPYVLDGLLSHESDLAPQEHYTDTHGYVALNFAAFPMFGKRFPADPGAASPVDLPDRSPEGLWTPHAPRQSAQAHPASRLEPRALGPHGAVLRRLCGGPDDRVRGPQTAAGLWAAESLLPGGAGTRARV